MPDHSDAFGPHYRAEELLTFEAMKILMHWHAFRELNPEVWDSSVANGRVVKAQQSYIDPTTGRGGTITIEISKVSDTPTKGNRDAK